MTAREPRIPNFLRCSSAAPAVMGGQTDPSLSAKIDISPEHIPTFGELKTVFKVAPETGALQNHGRVIVNGTAATWYADNQDFFSAFFGSSPVSDSDTPDQIIVKPPFKG